MLLVLLSAFAILLYYGSPAALALFLLAPQPLRVLLAPRHRGALARGAVAVLAAAVQAPVQLNLQQVLLSAAALHHRRDNDYIK